MADAAEQGTVGSYSLDKSKIKFLLLEGIHEQAREVIRSHGYQQVELLCRALTGAELAEALQSVHFVGIRSRSQVEAAAIAAADRLTAVGCFCIGTNQVDLKAAAHSGIRVFNAPFSNTRSVAELTLAECHDADARHSRAQRINSVYSGHAVNIASQHLETYQDTGYVVMDIETRDPLSLLNELREIPATIRARILH
jgi:hypothetical protein